MKALRQSMLPGPLAVVLVLSLALSWASAAPAGAPEMRDYPGLVRPSRHVELASPVPAELESVEVEEGDRVEAGQLLAAMDSALQELAVESARLKAESNAEVRRAKAVLAENQILLERAEQAFEADAASEWEVRRARLQRDQAEAAHQQAQEARRLAEVELALEQERLAKYRLYAPFAGHVVRVQAEPGARLEAGDSILVVVALEPLEAEIHLPSELYGQLVVGDYYHLEAEAPVGRQLTARLKTLDPLIDSASETFRSVFIIDNPSSSLPAGFTVRLVDLQVVDRR